MTFKKQIVYLPVFAFRMNEFKQRITVSAQSYDHILLDKYISKVLKVVSENDAYIIGPCPLLTQDFGFISQDNQGIQTKNISKMMHRRLLCVFNQDDSLVLVKKLQNLSKTNGIGVEIKLQD